MDVVDGDDHVTLGSQVAQDREQRGPDEPPLGRAGRLDPQQGDLERPPLRRGERRERLGADRGEQVGEPGEGQLHLRLDRPGHEHEGAAVARARDRLLPDGGLADARLADDRKRAGAALAQECLDDSELRVAPDDERHTGSVFAGTGPGPAPDGGKLDVGLAG